MGQVGGSSPAWGAPLLPDVDRHVRRLHSVLSLGPESARTEVGSDRIANHGACAVRPGRDARSVQDPDPRRGTRDRSPGWTWPRVWVSRGPPSRLRSAGSWSSAWPRTAALPRPGAGAGRRWWTSTRASASSGSTSVSPRCGWRHRRPARRPGARHRVGLRHPSRPRGGAGRGDRAHPQAPGRAGRRAARGRRDWRARTGGLPRRRPGVATDHAGVGRLPRPGRVLARARRPRAAGQRRQRDGAGRAAHGGRPIGVGVPVRQDRHRDRLRHRRRPPPLPRRRRVRRRHRAHPVSSGRAPCAPAGTTGAWRRSSGVPRWRATRPSAARAGRSAILAEMLEEDGELTAQHVGRAFGSR